MHKRLLCIEEETLIMCVQVAEASVAKDFIILIIAATATGGTQYIISGRKCSGALCLKL